MLRKLNARLAVGDFLQSYGCRSESTVAQHPDAPVREIGNAKDGFLLATKPTCGQLLAGRYKLGDLLGAQRHGDLYRAVDRETQLDVAVRFILKTDFADSKAIQEFLSCGRCCVDHPCPPVVDFFDIGENDDYCFVVMEFIEGHALPEHLQRRPDVGHRFGLNEALGYSRSLCGACTHATQAGIALQIDCNCVLLCGKAIRLSERARLRPRLRVSTSALGAGNAGPTRSVLDSARRDVQNTQSALYSLGVVVYDIFTDQKPHRMPAPLSSLRPGIPASLEDLMAQLLAKGSAHRPQSWEEVSVAFDAIAIAMNKEMTLANEEVDQLPVSPWFEPASTESQKNFRLAVIPNGYVQIAAALAGLLALSAGMLGAVPFVWSFPASGVQGASAMTEDADVNLIRYGEPVQVRKQIGAASSHLLDARPADVERARATPQRPKNAVQPTSVLLVSSPHVQMSLAGVAGSVGAQFRTPVAEYTWQPREPSRFAGKAADLSRPAPAVVLHALPPGDLEGLPDGPEYPAEQPRMVPRERDLASERARLLVGGAFDEFAPLISEEALPSDAMPASFLTGPITTDRYPFANEWIDVGSPPVSAGAHEQPRSPSSPFLRGDAAISELVLWLQNRTFPVVHPIVPNFTIGPIEIRHTRFEGLAGVEVCFPVIVSRFVGEALEIGAYVFNADGTPLKDLDRQYVSKRGNVYTKRAITIDSNQYRDERFTLFLPYMQFDGLPGGAHQLQAQVFIWAGPAFEQRMARSDSQAFELKLYRFNASPRGRE